MRLVRTIAKTPALNAVVDAEISPGPDLTSDDQINAFVRQQSWTAFHQCVTCRMGSDPAESVVDARLRVHGVAGLRASK